MYSRASLSVRSAGPSLTWIERVSGADHPSRGIAQSYPKTFARAFCIARQPHCRRALRAVASHHEGEWRHTPPRSKEGRAPTPSGVRLAAGEPFMSLYAQTWLPLVSFVLIAAIAFVVASFIIGGAEF